MGDRGASRKRGESPRLRDLEGRRPEDLRREATRRAVRERLNWRRYWNLLRDRWATLRQRLLLPGWGRLLLLALAGLLAAALALSTAGRPDLALLPALLGFGLASTGLVYGAAPRLVSSLEALPRPVFLAMWGLVLALFTLVGFSSTVVVLLVLFVGGFTAVSVLWALLPRALAVLTRREPGRSRGVVDGAANPNPFLQTFAVLAALALGASLLMGFTGLHRNGALGAALVGATLGLLAGMVPLEVRMVRQVLRPSLARWSLYRPERLLRDALFTAVVGGLVGYEVHLAWAGSALSGVPAMAVGLVLLSYLGIVVRRFGSLEARLRPYHPLVLPAFGALLLFAPLVVVLSSPPAAITRLYGAAQVAGLTGGTAYLALREKSRAPAERLRGRLERAVKTRIPLERGEDEGVGRYQRIGRSPGGSPGDGVRVREGASARDSEPDDAR